MRERWRYRGVERMPWCDKDGTATMIRCYIWVRLGWGDVVIERWRTPVESFWP
jgi:hypothetical protein